MTAHDILTHVHQKNYKPLPAKALAHKLHVSRTDYASFRATLKGLIQQGRLELGKNRSVRPPDPHGTVTGVYRGVRAGFGFVRPHVSDGPPGPDVYIPSGKALDAASGDEVLVRVVKKPSRPGHNPEGRVMEVLERATRQFVGTYFEQDGQGWVRVDGTVFFEPISVGDPGAKGAKTNDKVVVEMVRFPSPGLEGQAVLTELLGPRGAPGVDTLSIIREYNLAENFPEDALDEAREAARRFDESDHAGRHDFSAETVVTIDPTDARDFDDAVHIRPLPGGNWLVGVHIADVAYFVRSGAALDREARKRGTSVYLPDRVLPMLPELISNGLASLQEGVIRYTLSVLMELDPSGTLLHTEPVRGLIRVAKRLDYATAMDFLRHPQRYHGRLSEPVRELLVRMRTLAAILRERRRAKGFLELDLPEVKLELDDSGRFAAAHVREHDESHQMIEEFMLTANEAVAQCLEDRDLLFMRRVHGAPDPLKLKAFAEFARALGYKIRKPQSRYELQTVLVQSGSRPDRYAVHYGLLRSMKRAEYSPEEIGHYAIASDSYCHFTSPIRRYPDLLVHRLLERSMRSKKVSVDEAELIALGEHCTLTERRAADAERELIKLKILAHLVERIGLEMPAVITGVEDFGFFAQSVEFAIDGLVHVSTLADDHYRYEAATHTLAGVRSGRAFRLGDTVRVRVARVDIDRRQLDLQLVGRNA